MGPGLGRGEFVPCRLMETRPCTGAGCVGVACARFDDRPEDGLSPPLHHTTAHDPTLAMRVHEASVRAVNEAAPPKVSLTMGWPPPPQWLDEVQRMPSVQPPPPAEYRAAVKVVRKAVKANYGQSLNDRIGTPREIAVSLVAAVFQAGRLSDGLVVDEGPVHPDDIDEFAGAAGVGGMTRLWRASEIADVGLSALMRAGLLTERPPRARPDKAEWEETIRAFARARDVELVEWQVGWAAGVLAKAPEELTSTVVLPQPQPWTGQGGGE